MFSAVLSKLVAESLLSFYSIFVKKINIDLKTQVWSRFFTYAIISAFFIDFDFIFESIITSYGLLLSAITMIHVYASYRSFQLLESGIATTLYYVYPIFILLFSRIQISPVLFITLFGVYLISRDKRTDTIHKESFWNEGIIAAFVAALTEALIFLLVKKLKTMNNWNHLFLSYFLGAIAMSLYTWDSIIISIPLSLSLLVNVVIGLFGYYLRFYAISRLDANIYAPLSYFGIIMSYIYGVFLNKDIINIQKIIGTICIVFTNLYIFYSQSRT
jgi:drug/metabolite transporter (DMT)-like permease